ncbi:hypothetical protein [Ewingella americana]|jgi:hypothetical protein|uniref:Uncharacterized protein n=1 Tax=Ewingella americana TaxID=41202 RepID=A0A502G0W3_9GAMM|nr:hypothetical protein [Ewingella americana]TPG55409.1 hypothetical protein EAH77_23595 [Ewingella americana]
MAIPVLWINRSGQCQREMNKKGLPCQKIFQFTSSDVKKTGAKSEYIPFTGEHDTVFLSLNLK